MGLHIEIDSGADMADDQQQAAVVAAQDLAKALTSLGLAFTGHVHTNSIKQALLPGASVSVTPGPIGIGNPSPASAGSPPGTPK